MTAWQKNMIERATAVQGVSLTDFVLGATIERAQEVLADQPVFLVDQATWDEFNRVLDEPSGTIAAVADLLNQPSVLD
jgi:uncharacterized protein (DUF1778 family)